MNFDIFISYKTHDVDGHETRDSVIARELHSRLTEMGYSVFFSEKTMEELAISNFFLEIENALASAKIMIVVLTNREYATASWVQHEWSTFCSANPNNLLYTLTEKLNVCDLPPTLHAKQNFDYANDGVAHLCNFIHNAKFSIVSGEQVSAKNIEDFIEKEGISICKNKYGGFTSEILEESSFLKIRNELIKNSKDWIILVGQSLRDAFTYGNNACVIDTLKNCIEKKQLSEIKFLITDPAMFNVSSELQQRGDTPLDRVSTTMNAIIERILPSSKGMGCKIKVFFTPLIHIDHTIISGDFMAFRSTKLWTQDASFKGAFFIYKKYNESKSNEIKSEYEAHLKYLEKIMDNCTKIDLDIDIIREDDNRYNNLPEAMKRHYRWRNEINESDYRDCIELYKLHNTQLVNYVIDTWSRRKEKVFLPSESNGIKNYDDLFNSQNLLDDKTQEILLEYIKKTGKMFEEIVRQYDSTVVDYKDDKKKHQSWVKVFPSLDLGFPNNIQRLAGGFATGMFIMWKCGTPIVPIDATVNVCSSSVFEIDKDKAKIDLNMDCDNFKEWIESKEEDRKGIIEKISKEKHCKFSFDNGNHFLMIAQDQDDKSENFKKFYLVLHSSAVEFKESYVGLYPTENNWYSDYIKTKESNNNDGRYIRYIKDKEAASFIDFAHKLEKYNMQLHKYVAEDIGCVRNTELKQNTFHHYYMPNDSSIAIGTYVERPGTIVPLFSNVGKPIYMFEVGQDNWKIKLAGKGEVCLIPHGWGQEIDNIQSIKLKINKNGDGNKIILEKDNVGDLEWDIKSSARIKEDDKHKSIGKHIRNFEDGQAFLDKGKKMIKGKIVQTLMPIYLYCNTKKGKINEPVQ